MGRPATCACGECPKCKHRIYMRSYYYTNGRKTYLNREKRRAYDNNRYHNDPEYRKKHFARQALAKQVRQGIQVRGQCALCDQEATVGHHNDYDKPLEGVFLCNRCHEAVHNALPAF